jgi:aminopeptidase N
MLRIHRILRDYENAGSLNSLIALWGFVDDHTFLTKAGTEDLQRAMEAAAGQSLTRFFEQWIYASGLPRVRYSTATEGQELIVRFEQVGEVFDVPVTVTLNYRDRSVDEIVALTDAVVVKRFPLAGSLRNVAINDDHAALGHFDRR